MHAAFSVAESVLKCNAICAVCGGMASRTQRLNASTARVVVGAANVYEARCRGCFDPQLAEQKSNIAAKISGKTKSKGVEVNP